MNIVLWVLQILLGLYYLMGGGWMVSKVPGGWLKLLPKPVWMAIGLLQVLLAVGLVVPKLTPLAAVGVAVETLLVSALTKPKFQGFLWVLIPAVLALFLAYGRFVLVPF
jgi:hypothetical protein